MRALALALVAVVALAVAGCGSGDDTASADDATQKIADAIEEPGQVFHAVADDGSEVWLDAEQQRYRRKEPDAQGGLTSVGEGWIRYEYDPFSNEVTQQDLSPSGNQRPRIDDPMVGWFEVTSALGYGTELRMIGRTTSDGREVLAIEARSPIVQGETLTGGYLIGRVEVDPETYLPVAFERREIVPSGQTPSSGIEGSDAPKRVRYTTVEHVPRESLGADFFAQSVVEDLVLSPTEYISQIEGLGLTPYWLGEDYVGDGGPLSLPDKDAIFVDPTNQKAEFHYDYLALVTQTSAEPLANSVIVRLGTNVDDMGPPTIDQYGGEVPEDLQQVTARGGPALVYTSILTPSDLPCEGECPQTGAPLYTRVLLQVGDTAVQIEAMARVDATGADRNGYNNRDAIIKLAEALAEAPSAEDGG